MTGAFGDQSRAFLELDGAFGDLPNQLGKIGEHLADAGSQLVDGLIPLDFHVFGEIALGGRAYDPQEAVDFAPQFGGLFSFILGNLGGPLLRGLLLVEELLQAFSEIRQCVFSGDLQLLGVIALGDVAQDFEHPVYPALHGFDGGVDDLRHLHDLVAAGFRLLAEIFSGKPLDGFHAGAQRAKNRAADQQRDSKCDDQRHADGRNAPFVMRQEAAVYSLRAEADISLIFSLENSRQSTP